MFCLRDRFFLSEVNSFYGTLRATRVFAVGQLGDRISGILFSWNPARAFAGELLRRKLSSCMMRIIVLLREFSLNKGPRIVDYAYVDEVLAHPGGHVRYHKCAGATVSV